eukprot:10503582-Prorocentrum_lima.AAC.1
MLGKEPVRFEVEFNQDNIQGMFDRKTLQEDDDVDYSYNCGRVSAFLIEVVKEDIMIYYVSQG